ncbi:MAG: aminomethyl-transferring glycine dehydrogenase subunit GcvPA [Firmicutes bacterium]|nr:aminomethyl-transferring glycine dehydrogenase subunit GcvPA [Bacillota bacterium]
MGSYIPSTYEERLAMLAEIGMTSKDDLFSALPESIKIKELNIPSGLSEVEVSKKMRRIADKNVVLKSIFRGAGSYNHYIPSIVKTVTSKEEFLTAYTPYQAEISQGVLQSIFEYQTQICELTGMDVSNASVYDGAVAAAEAVFMCQERKRKGVVVAGTSDPQTIEIIKTYCASRDVEVKVVGGREEDSCGNCSDIFSVSAKALAAALADDTACVYVQSPNYYGVIEDMDALVSVAHEKGVKVIMGANPISLGLLKTPGEYGVDIAVGEGQPLGLPLSFGGPYLGYMACTNDMMRKLPGRIVGETEDHDGRRAFVLTLQAREQHIRREKASSNICSNEALCAMTASVYMAAMGPSGLKEVAETCAANAHYLASKLAEIDGVTLVTDKTFFNEFVTRLPIEAKLLEEKLAERGILAGLPVGDHCMLWCCTELNDKEEIDALVDAVKEVVK